MQDIEALRKRYVRLYGDEGVAEQDLGAIESSLNLCLPEDFRRIARFFGGGCLGTSHHAIAPGGPADNVVEETLRLRTSVGLPHGYVVLAEPAESLIVMDSGSSEVFWIDASDANRLADPRLLRKPQVFQSYADFFERLLGEAEADLRDA
jgi:hypothetical protein